jgi:hypothetical protein
MNQLDLAGLKDRARKKRLDREPLDMAVHKTAKGYVGPEGRGIEHLARVVNSHPSFFRNKVRPDLPDHRITLKEVRAMMLVTKDYRILRALANDVGHDVFLVPKSVLTSDMNILESWAAWQGQIARTTQTIQDSLKGNLSHQDLFRIREELTDDFRKGLQMLATLEKVSEHY